MSIPEKFVGYACFSKDQPTTLKPLEFTPKKFQEHDVDIRIKFCGVLPSMSSQLILLSRYVEVTFTLCVLDG